MGFVTPVWLWAILPWAGLVLWMFTGQRQRAIVPFLDLWRGPVKGPRVKRTIEAPPLAILCTLLAILCAIFGAARPSLDLGLQQGPLITIIVDRGITMSPRGKHQARWRELIDECYGVIARETGLGPVDLITIPGPGAVRTDRSDWISVLNEASSSIKTPALLRTAIASELARHSNPIIVLTDRTLDVTNNRLAQIAPVSMPQNAGIVAVAARQTPRPQ